MPSCGFKEQDCVERGDGAVVTFSILLVMGNAVYWSLQQKSTGRVDQAIPAPAAKGLSASSKVPVTWGQREPGKSKISSSKRLDRISWTEAQSIDVKIVEPWLMYHRPETAPMEIGRNNRAPEETSQRKSEREWRWLFALGQWADGIMSTISDGGWSWCCR